MTLYRAMDFSDKPDQPVNRLEIAAPDRGEAALRVLRLVFGIEIETADETDERPKCDHGCGAVAMIRLAEVGLCRDCYTAHIRAHPEDAI